MLATTTNSDHSGNGTAHAYVIISTSNENGLNGIRKKKQCAGCVSIILIILSVSDPNIVHCNFHAKRCVENERRALNRFGIGKVRRIG